MVLTNNDWSNAGGCFLILNKEKRAECQRNESKNIKAQADLELAQALRDKVNQPKQSGWTATQTTVAVVGSLLAITLMVVVIKRMKSSK